MMGWGKFGEVGWGKFGQACNAFLVTSVAQEMEVKVRFTDV